ncbi:single-stranded-DNA-specific exonuclease RecJ [Candidatus Babeliales bacterium]|nr:single-stranded-DNA-specific exonuclease RecJ [Candidatus Babeliales bacterium]
MNNLHMQGKKYLWRLKKKPDIKKINAIAAAHSLSLPIAHTLFSRDLITRDQVNSFLFTSLEKDVADSRLLKGAEIAVERLEQAVKDKEKILVFGDYDVDGITSTSLMLASLMPLGASINYYLPNRAKEGYGLSVAVVEKAAKHNYGLLVTVDNGITAHEPAKRAQELGLDLIITDHHRPHETLPVACAIIDPNQDGCEFPHKTLAGVGVIFKIISLLYEKRGLELPSKVFELLMLGTVADMVPLQGENRFWVRHGLCKTNQQRSLALQVLADNNNLRKRMWGSLDIGFMIAPQINALGRLADPREAVKFLISSNKNDVSRIGKILKEMNDERKRVERSIYEEIDSLIVNGTIDLSSENIIMAADSRWPSGVIGLVAGRLMQNYGKPAFLFHEQKDGTLRGSCRSIPEFDMFNALQANKDLLLSFGGHSFAAGLKLKRENVEKFKERLEERIAQALPPEVLQPKIELDADCSLSDLNQKLMSDLTQLEPFGNSNSQPMFLIKDLTLLNAPKILKDKHVKCSVFSDGVIKPVIFFNRPDLFPFFKSIGDKTFSIAGHGTKNEWQDQVKIELQGLDVAA